MRAGRSLVARRIAILSLLWSSFTPPALALAQPAVPQPPAPASAAPQPPAPAPPAPASASAAPEAAAPEDGTPEAASAPAPPPPATAAHAPPAPAPPSASAAPAPLEAPVVFHDTTLFVVRAPLGALSPDVRAKNALAAIKEAAGTATADDVRVEIRDDNAVVYVGQTPITTVTKEDAALGGDASVEDHAAAIASTLRDTLRSERQRSAIAKAVFSFSLVVVLGLVALYLLRKVRDFSARAREWIADNPDRIPAIRVRTLEVIGPRAIRAFLDLTFAAGRWVAQVGILYAWLLVVLSMFESTRAYTERLTGFVLAPLSQLAGRVAGALPIVVIALLAGLAVVILLRFAGAFFDSAARGEVDVGWLPRDLARPAGILVRAGIVVGAIVFAAPLVTGEPDGALARVGIVTVAVFGLATLPLCASLMVGILVVFLRRVQPGELVDFGGRRGWVLGVGLLDVRLRGEDGSDMRVPHLLSLVHPTQSHGKMPPVTIEVPASSAHPHRELGLRLREAAAAVGEQATAQIAEVRDGHVVWRVTVTSSSPDARAKLYEAVLDALAAEATAPRRERVGAA